MPERIDPLALSHAQIATLIAAAPAPAEATRIASYLAGDHWQGGAGWMGPRPPASAPEFGATMELIKTAFVSKNVLTEVVARHVAATVGREPAWAYTPLAPARASDDLTRAETGLVAEAEALVTPWWDVRDAAQLVQDALSATLAYGSAVLRLYLPPGRVADDGTVPPGLASAQLDRLFVEVCARGTAAVIRDRHSETDIGLYQVTDDKVLTSEVHYTAEGADGRRLTFVRVLRGDLVLDYPPYDLGGALLLHALRRPALITATLLQLQGLLNMGLTMLGRNVVQGGFLERIITNGLLPEVGGIGAGITTSIMGEPLRDATGAITGYTSPGVVYRDPVPIDTFVGTKDAAYRAMLEEAHQLHALISGDATASGESRKQAMADFLADVGLSVPAVVKAVRWLIGTPLTLAALLAGQGGRYATLRPEAQCRVDPGPLSGSDRAALLAEYAAGVRSQETTMALLGVDDVGAELARLAAEAQDAAPVAPPPGNVTGRPDATTEEPTP